MRLLKRSGTIPLPAVPIIRDELSYRLRQQSLLGEFGRIAMQTRDFGRILQRATDLCAQGLAASCAKVLEYEPDEKRLSNARSAIPTNAFRSRSERRPPIANELDPKRSEQ